MLCIHNDSYQTVVNVETRWIAEVNALLAYLICLASLYCKYKAIKCLKSSYRCMCTFQTRYRGTKGQPPYYQSERCSSHLNTEKASGHTGTAATTHLHYCRA